MYYVEIAQLSLFLFMNVCCIIEILWGYVKGKVYQKIPTTIEDLKQLYIVVLEMPVKKTLTRYFNKYAYLLLNAFNRAFK